MRNIHVIIRPTIRSRNENQEQFYRAKLLLFTLLNGLSNRYGDFLDLRSVANKAIIRPGSRPQKVDLGRLGTSSRIGSVLRGPVDPPSNVELKIDFTASRLKTDFCLCTSGSVVCQFLNPPVFKIICLPLFVCLFVRISVCLLESVPLLFRLESGDLVVTAR